MVVTNDRRDDSLSRYQLAWAGKAMAPSRARRRRVDLNMETPVTHLPATLPAAPATGKLMPLKAATDSPGAGQSRRRCCVGPGHWWSRA
ncbi:hypothetical protein D3C86_1607310 [compost metagenome]